MNNLAFGPAVLGNTVVWKPAESASLVAHLSLQLLREAGLPDGVINIVYGDGAEIGEVALTHRDLAAVHFTGSTATFQHIWRTVGANVANYKNYPRVVGETGGKDFIVAHPSRRRRCARRGLRARRLRVPGPEVLGRLAPVRAAQPVAGSCEERLVALTESVVVGDPTETETYVGAVINAKQHAKHAEALARARSREPGRRRRQHRRLRRLVRRPDRARGVRPALAVHHPGAVRAGAHHLRLRRRRLGRHAARWSTSPRRTG